MQIDLLTATEDNSMQVNGRQCWSRCSYYVPEFAAILAIESLRAVFDPGQVHGFVVFFLDLQKHGYRIAQIFFGIGLFPFGYLSSQSGLIHKIIGVGMMIASFSFLIDFFLFSLYQITRILYLHGLPYQELLQNLECIFGLSKGGC